MITIPELRARNKKMSQQELANAINVDVGSIARWERDIYSISAHNLKKLSNYFNVSADNLLGIEKNFSA